MGKLALPGNIRSGWNECQWPSNTSFHWPR